LVTIHVDDRWRGQGIGSRLLDAFDAELTRTGVRDCFLGAIPANTRAIDLYVVMLTDSNVIQACQQRGFLPGWLQLRRDLCQDS
jgi:GNAT superfamily N-acetyltransferase